LAVLAISPLAFADLLARPLVGLPREAALERHLVARAVALGKAWTPRLRADGFAAMADHVAAGVGLAVLPLAAARRLRAARGLACRPLGAPWAKRRLVLCVRLAEPVPKPVAVLIDHLRAPSRRP
jgi:DNA-binding transcriptional LysR family regulator